MTHPEKVEMYQKIEKDKLIEMLIEANNVINKRYLLEKLHSLWNDCSIRAMTTNEPMLYEGGEIDAHLVSLAEMTNRCTNFQLRNAAPLLYSICWQQLIFSKWKR